MVRRERTTEELEEEIRRNRTHPYGVKPLGNLIMSGDVNSRDIGLGKLRTITDGSVSEIVSYCSAESVVRLSAASRSLYAFCHSDEVWKPLTLFTLRDDGKFFFTNNWKQTYLTSRLGQEKAPIHTPIVLTNFYSDTLHHVHQDSSIPIPAKWTTVNNVDRRHVSTMSKKEFQEQYEQPGKPVVIQGLVENWGSFKKWDWDFLIKQWGDVEYQCEAARLTLKEFKQYCDQQRDDRPIYLFDQQFCSTSEGLASDFEVPEYFNDDLFSVLGERRPDFRWLIAGPARSGSSFHKDPNATDAWNACIRGVKKWIFFPPSVVPPGVICSEDGADVTSPMSLVEWFSNYYHRCDEVDVPPIEALVQPGEMMYIPNGWWHLCLNLTPTICITQNYVSRVGLRRVLTFLKSMPHCVSGVPCERRDTLHSEFREALSLKYSELLEQVDEEEKQDAKPHNDPLPQGDEGGFSFDF